MCLLFSFLSLSAFGQSTSSGNVSVFEIQAPALDTIRKIWIWTPADYDTVEKRYPVLYMHDAQNLFDASTSYSGEWKIDEYLDSLPNPNVIVVGIEHGNEKRISELTPFSHEKYGGGEAEKYLEFLRKTLKPHIDSTFRTLPDRDNTVIMGSSLGGLLSFYAAVKYPETFGRAGVFSPSFWFSDEIYTLTKNAIFDTSSKFYFMAGTNEDESLVPDVEKMIKILQDKGLPQQNIKLKVVEGGEHNEAAWSREFPEAFQWLFPETSRLRFKIRQK